MSRRTALFAAVLTLAAVALVYVRASAFSSPAIQQPKLGGRKVPTLTVDQLAFKDLNKNGALDKYEDWRLPVDVRVSDLVSKMTLRRRPGLWSTLR